MKIIRSHAELLAYRASLPATSTVGFVPTMGGLHAGHTSLLTLSRRDNNISLASIFVNPAQFAPGEDFASYPRTEDADLSLCASHGADAVYLPRAEDVYPAGYETYVEAGCGGAARNARSEGASRPTFFRGVATLVLKLGVAARPHRLYVGQKDAQQCAVVRAVVRDVGLPLEVVVGETVREADGLAMSTRNQYLAGAERSVAGGVWAALREGAAVWARGERDAESVRAVVREKLADMRGKGASVEVLYVSLCDRESMREVEGTVEGGGKCVVCVAVMVGKARLIDNVVLE